MYDRNMRNKKGQFIKGEYVGFGFKKGHKAWNKGIKGTHFSRKTEFKKGMVPWNKGLPEHLQTNWRGNRVGYWGIHSWIEKQLGTPRRCEKCGTTSAKKYDWSNKSGNYKRNISDWQRLCVTCHFYYDRKKFGKRKNFRRKYY